MLTGESRHQLDERGRVAVPKGYWEALEHGAFITRGWHGCLFLFPWMDWANLESRLAETRLTDLNGEMVARFLAAGEKVWVDRQGRVLLPTTLREWAGVDKEVVLVGGLRRIEVWARDRWDAFQAEQFTPEQILSKAASLGI